MLAQKAVDLILEFEGLDQPSQWPGGQSGITLGHGYDLGYYSAQEYARDWATHLSAEDLARLRVAIGKTGAYAKRLAPEFRGIVISRQAARSVFESATLPKFTAQTRLAFPGAELLPDVAFGALVSIVFNRGPGLDGERRQEMANIRSKVRQWALLSPDEHEFELPDLLKGIAAEVRKMKRLWIGKGLDGLLRRRDAEAALIESAA